MELKLMMTNDNYDVLNKDKFTIGIEQIQLTKDVNVLNPIITLYTKTSLQNINYAYIPELERYYFIVNKQILGNNLTKLALEVDVLESYKNEILESQSIQYLNSVLPDTKIYESDFIPHEMSYILATVGERVSE